MSTKSTERGPLEIPRLDSEAQEFAETLLALGMPYEFAVQSFLDCFPSYLEDSDLTEAEVYEILGNRFKDMRRRTKRLSYHRIKETEASLKKMLDCIPVASPLMRLIELEQMRQDGALKPEQRIKVLAAAAKENERLMPRERTSPFSSLPNLPGLPTASESTTPENAENKESPPRDPFGGAIMNNVNTGQEKP